MFITRVAVLAQETTQNVSEKADLYPKAAELITAPWDRPQARIDHVLLGPDLPRARSARALSSDASDHALVVVEL